MCMGMLLPLNLTATCNPETIATSMCEEVNSLTDFERTTLAHTHPELRETVPNIAVWSALFRLPDGLRYDESANMKSHTYANKRPQWWEWPYRPSWKRHEIMVSIFSMIWRIMRRSLAHPSKCCKNQPLGNCNRRHRQRLSCQRIHNKKWHGWIRELSFGCPRPSNTWSAWPLPRCKLVRNPDWTACISNTILLLAQLNLSGELDKFIEELGVEQTAVYNQEFAQRYVTERK